MSGTQGLLAIHRIDFFTAARILLNKKVIDGIYNSGMEEPTGRVFLVKSLQQAIHMKSKHGTPVVFIVCMDSVTANIYGIDIIDTEGQDFPIINFNKIAEAVKQLSGPHPVLLHIPIINVDKIIIKREVDRLQSTQILSHYNTFLYALPKSMREEMQIYFLSWLEGKINTNEFYAHMSRKNPAKATDTLLSLVNFMRLDCGKAYPRVFSKLFKGEDVKHSLPIFEVNYFAKLKERLAKT